MKIFLKSVLILSIPFLFTYCKSDDENVDEPIVETSEGVFLDATVQGLTYASFSVSGKTDEEGKFEYENDKTISFSVGGIALGESMGKDVITPLDLVGADINDQEVRNVASFLQALDNDKNPSNGILITEETDQALENETLDFQSENFLTELTELIGRVNDKNASSLAVVYSNDAALHLAKTLNIEEQFEFLPRVISGRQWEEGEYYSYNTTPMEEYILKIGSTLDGVRYNVGGNNGFYMDMVYEQDTLKGLGNVYTDLDADPPVNPNPNYEFRNRITSPGFVIDYQNQTYIGYFNYFKKEGQLGKIQGTYESFFFYDQKFTGAQERDTFLIQKIEIIIEDANAEGDFPVRQISYDADNNIKEDVSFIVNKDFINEENIVLVRFQETDYIFINFDISEMESYFHPGLFCIKK